MNSTPACPERCLSKSNPLAMPKSMIRSMATLIMQITRNAMNFNWHFTCAAVGVWITFGLANGHLFAQSNSVSEIGRWPSYTRGHANVIRLQGDYACVGMSDAGWAGGTAVNIFSISDPLAPTLVGSYSYDHAWEIFAMKILDHTVYVADDAGITILSIADPAHPTILGRYRSTLGAHSIDTDGKICIIGSERGVYEIVDVSDPRAPFRVTRASIITGAYDINAVVLLGDVAYVGGDTGNVWCLDISTPSSPQVKSVTPMPGGFRPRSMHVLGTRLVIGGGGLFWFPGNVSIFEIVDRTNLVLRSSITVVGAVLDCDAPGATLYVATGTVALQTVDITDVTRPRLLATIATDSDTAIIRRGLCVRNGFGFVADGSAGLRVINCSEASAPHPLNEFDTKGMTRDVQLVENTAFLADYNNGLQIVDVSKLEQPELIGGVRTTNGYAMQLKVLGDVCFIANGPGGLQPVNIANKRLPSLYKPLSIGDEALCVCLVGNKALVGYSGGFKVIDVSNPGSLVEQVDFKCGGSVRDIVVDEGRAYLACNGLRIVDVANPLEPKMLGSLAGSSAWGLAVRAKTVYMANGDSGLYIIDADDPSKPVVKLNGIPGMYQARAVTIQQNYAFVACGQNGLEIIDISNNAAPVRLPKFNTTGYCFKYQGNSKAGFVADGDYGLRVLSIKILNQFNPTMSIRRLSDSISIEVSDLNGVTMKLMGSSDLVHWVNVTNWIQTSNVFTSQLSQLGGSYNFFKLATP